MTEPSHDPTEQSHDPEVFQLAAHAFERARSGDTDTLAAYVDAGVPAGLSTPAGDSLVMVAASHGHAKTVSALLERGADPNRANDRGQTPLAGAVLKGADEVVRILLAHGANPRAGTPSAIETAAARGRQDLVDLFQQ